MISGQVGWGLVAAAVLAAATVVGSRQLARRGARPVEVRVTGDVPAVPDWIPEALTAFASETPGIRTELTDDMDGPILRGHHAVVGAPSGGLELQLRMQPHLVRQTRGPDHPFVVVIETTAAPLRTGLGRVLFGQTPTPEALAVRTKLQQAIVRAARGHDLVAKTTTPTTGAPVAVLGTILVVLALLATLIGPIAGLMSDRADPSPSPTPARWYPAGSTECPAPAKKPAKGPTRTAVAKGTSCAFAATVRAGYAKAKISGKRVKLGKLAYDKSTKLDVTCTVAKPYATCKAGSKIIYLH